jgi:hypothetical protein
MLHLIIGVLWFLVFLCILVGVGWLVVWVLGQLGIPVPPMVLKIVLLVIALLCLIYFITLIAGSGGLALPALR